MCKKLFAVIMSIMMMVTFMPAMAFATPGNVVTDVDWTVTDNSISAVVSYTVGGVAHKPMKVDAAEMTYQFIDDNYAGPFSDAPKGVTAVSLPDTLYWGTGDTVDYTTVDEDDNYSNDSYIYVFDFTDASIVKYDEIYNKDRIMRVDADTYCDMVDQTGTQPKLKAGYGLEDILGSDIKFVQPAITMEDGGTPKVGHFDYTEGLTDFAKLLGTSKVKAQLSALPIVSAIIASVKLPTYEKYQEDKNFPVTVSLEENKMVNFAEYGLYFTNLNKAVSDHQVYIYSGVNSTIDLTMGDKTKTISLSSEPVSFEDVFFSDSEENIFIGFYNGENQSLQATTKGVKVEYSTDFGRTYGATPTFKNATLSYLEFISAYAALTVSGSPDEIMTSFVNKLLDNLVYIKVTKGSNAPQYGAILPIILPREFIVEYKSKELNFEPGKDVTAKDALRAKALTGYDSISDILMDEILNNPLDIQKAMSLLNTSRTDICAADKATAEKFVEKYFTLKDMPTTGKGNKVEFGKNVNFDINALAKDIKTDAELAAFMNNYDILPELLLMIDSNMLDADLTSLLKYIGFNYDDFNNNEAEYARDQLESEALGKLIPVIVKDLQSRINTTATVNFVNTKIVAKNKTKTYHIKNAKALKSTKTFAYKAISNTGKVAFKKLSGNKKITINKSTGRVTVKKGLKKGAYKVRVRLTSNEKSVTKIITVKVVK